MRWPWTRPEPEPEPEHDPPDDPVTIRLRHLAEHWQRDPGVRVWGDLLPARPADPPVGNIDAYDQEAHGAAGRGMVWRGQQGSGVAGLGVVGHGTAREQSAHGLSAFTEPTQVLPTRPVITPARRMRGEGGGWR